VRGREGGPTFVEERPQSLRDKGGSKVASKFATSFASTFGKKVASKLVMNLGLNLSLNLAARFARELPGGHWRVRKGDRGKGLGIGEVRMPTGGRRGML
jgi:hypothetical protein